MSDASRRVYLALGRAFVAIGGIVALGSVLDRALGWGFFSGSPVGTAALLVLVGALLLWTVRQADAGAGPGDPDAETAVETGVSTGADADAEASADPDAEASSDPERP